MRVIGLNSDLPYYSGELRAKLIRGDGTHRDLGILSNSRQTLIGGLAQPISWWKWIWRKLRRDGTIPLALTFVAFLESIYSNSPVMLGLVTTAGVGFLATDMASGQASPRISSMNFHDSGTGATAAAIGDTALQTQAGPATRATGTQSNPSAGVYRTIGTITYTGTLAVTEWGLFNQAAQGGTLWDHRVFAAVNVVNTDQILYQYSLTVNAGGT